MLLSLCLNSVSLHLLLVGWRQRNQKGGGVGAFSEVARTTMKGAERVGSEG